MVEFLEPLIKDQMEDPVAEALSAAELRRISAIAEAKMSLAMAVADSPMLEPRDRSGPWFTSDGGTDWRVLEDPDVRAQFLEWIERDSGQLASVQTELEFKFDEIEES